MSDRRQRLVEQFLETAELYSRARISARVPLSMWPALDAAFIRLGERLGYSRRETEVLLRPKPQTAIEPTPSVNTLTSAEIRHALLSASGLKVGCVVAVLLSNGQELPYLVTSVFSSAFSNAAPEATGKGYELFARVVLPSVARGAVLPIAGSNAIDSIFYQSLTYTADIIEGHVVAVQDKTPPSRPLPCFMDSDAPEGGVAFESDEWHKAITISCNQWWKSKLTKEISSRLESRKYSLENALQRKQPRVIAAAKKEIAQLESAQAQLSQAGAPLPALKHTNMLEWYENDWAWIKAMSALKKSNPTEFDLMWEAVHPYLGEVDQSGNLVRMEAPKFNASVHDSKPAVVEAAPKASGESSQALRLEIISDRDTRDGSALWVARIPARVGKDEYSALSTKVKAAGGYWSRLKRGFIFRKDPTEDLQKAGLADELQALHDAAMLDSRITQSLMRSLDALHDECLSDLLHIGDSRGAGLSDTSLPTKKHRLRKLFRELVALYVITLCAGKIEGALVPVIDTKFDSIARVVGEDFAHVKAAEMDSCTPPAEQAAQEPIVAPAPALPEDEVVKTPQATAVSSLPAIDRSLPADTFRRFALPWVITTLSSEAEAEWLELKARIAQLEKKPEDFNGSAKDYLASVSNQVERLRNSRDAAYKVFTAMRGRTRLDPDAPELVTGAAHQRSRELFTERSGILSEEMIKAAQRDLENEMLSGKLYEHYPTPEHVIRMMIEGVDLRPGNRVLEPSAGEGNIAGMIRLHAPEAVLDVVEYAPLLADILTLKRFNVVGSDFLAYNTTSAVKYDAVVMNPPFDKGVDIEHVYHAFKMLSPGGKLVAIVSGRAIDGSDEENYAFKEFVSKRGSWKMFTPKEYMGPSGKLSNGRSINIVVAMVSIERKQGDTHGHEVKTMDLVPAGVGQVIYDSQGAQGYKITAIEEKGSKLVTTALNLSTGHSREFSGHISTGGRFVAMESEKLALSLVSSSGSKHDVNSDGTIKLPPFPKAPAAGDSIDGLKPLRIVTSRPELMPAAPLNNLFEESIASNVTLTPGQIEGINRALFAMYNPPHSFLLADGTGFGKTLQELIIAASVLLREKRPVVIFTKDPQIIETSFFVDARKLKISTPDALNQKDRAAFKEGKSAGISIRRARRIEDLLSPKIKNDIYIASYHVFGRWDGDKEDRARLTQHKVQLVDPLKAKFSQRRKDLDGRARYMGDESLRAAKEELKREEDLHPVMARYRELVEIVQKKNEEVFGEIGRRFAAVISDEGHAYKNYNPEDFNDGSAQAFRGMVLNSAAKMRAFATATPADKVDHIRYLKGLNVYKTEAQYIRLMDRLGFKWIEPEYKSGTLVKRGKFAFDEALPPEYVLANISRLFENLTMSGTMVKRELSLDNFEARNIMIGGPLAPPAEKIAVGQALNKLAEIDALLGKKKRCKASIINEKKWSLEPYKIQKAIEITKKEVLEGRQVVIFASLVNDSGPNYTGSTECSAVDKPSTVNTLARELGALFGESTIGFVTGDRRSDAETLSDCDDCHGTSTSAGILLGDNEPTAMDEMHQRQFFLGDPEGISSAGEPLADGLSDSQKKRTDDIRAFQEGRKRILIATPGAGGTGISLDDTVGNAPRTIIIMTSPFSSVEVVQILGRINRVKTRSRQRAYFLWVDVPVDRRLRDIIASKLRVLGAAVQGEVKKVSVEEAEFASTENAQENYDKHNVDKDGTIRKHSLSNLQVIDGERLPSRIPFTLTHKSQLTLEIEPETQLRARRRPIRMKSNLKSGAREALKEWMRSNAALVAQFEIRLETDRYEGPYLETSFNDELWQVLLNFLKPENTRFIIDQAQRYNVGDRVVAATDIIEAGAKVGMPGTVTRVWPRRVRALDRESGNVVLTPDGQIVFNTMYDYMVEFDNGERANNLESWELMPAHMSLDADDENDSIERIRASEPSLADGGARAMQQVEPVVAPAETIVKEKSVNTAAKPRAEQTTLADREKSVRARVREMIAAKSSRGKGK